MLLSQTKKEEKKVANGLLLIFFDFFLFFIFINYVMLLYLKSFALALVDEFRNFAFYRIIVSDWREKSRVLAVVKRRESRMEKEKKNNGQTDNPQFELRVVTSLYVIRCSSPHTNFYCSLISLFIASPF